MAAGEAVKKAKQLCKPLLRKPSLFCRVAYSGEKLEVNLNHKQEKNEQSINVFMFYKDVSG